MPPRPDLFLGALLAATALLLAGCSAAGEGRGSAAANGSAGGGLEEAALDSGAIEDPSNLDPAGSYGQTYDGGRDRLCIGASSADEGKGDHPFALEVRFGEEEYCAGSGTARRAGESLLMRFQGDRCLIVARYEGDRVVLPGAVDTNCAHLCSNHGSLAGVAFPRTGAGDASARRARTRDGMPLCT
jgi:hypothetical protein